MREFTIVVALEATRYGEITRSAKSFAAALAQVQLDQIDEVATEWGDHTDGHRVVSIAPHRADGAIDRNRLRHVDAYLGVDPVASVRQSELDDLKAVLRAAAAHISACSAPSGHRVPGSLADLERALTPFRTTTA